MKNNIKIGFKETEIGLIPKEWNLIKLSDLIDIKHGFAFKGKYFSDEETPYVLLTPGNFKVGGGFNNSKYKYYNGKIPKDYVLNEGDMIVTMTDLSKNGDTLGYSAKVPVKSDKIFLHNQRLGLIIFNSKRIFPDFLYWKLRNYDYRHWVLATATGTTVKHTSPSRILGFEFALPPINEQKSIANIFSTIDSKIELNQRINQTLEEIGRAIFKHWFVDFEFPDEQGRPYKSSGGEMVNSELGEIPKGWEVRKIKDFGKVVCGKTPPKSKSEYFGGDIPFIKIPDMHGETFVIKTEDSLTKEGENFQKNKTIPAKSVCVSCIATVGLVCLTDRNVQTNQQINSIIPKKQFYSYYLYYELNLMEEFLQIMASGGSATLNLNTKNFSNIDLIMPALKVLEDFHRTICPLFNQILNNIYQIQKLSQIRDSLLPKLMSGKIRVK